MRLCSCWGCPQYGQGFKSGRRGHILAQSSEGRFGGVTHCNVAFVPVPSSRSLLILGLHFLHRRETSPALRWNCFSAKRPSARLHRRSHRQLLAERSNLPAALELLYISHSEAYTIRRPVPLAGRGVQSACGLPARQPCYTVIIGRCPVRDREPGDQYPRRHVHSHQSGVTGGTMRQSCSIGHSAAARAAAQHLPSRRRRRSSHPHCAHQPEGDAACRRKHGTGHGDAQSHSTPDREAPLSATEHDSFSTGANTRSTRNLLLIAPLQLVRSLPRRLKRGLQHGLLLDAELQRQGLCVTAMLLPRQRLLVLLHRRRQRAPLRLQRSTEHLQRRRHAGSAVAESLF